MKSILGRWLFITLVIFAIPYIVSGVYVETLGTALAAAAVLSIFNVILKPILILFTLPLTVFTLGFFLLIINAVVFQLVGVFVSGLHVESFWSAFFASLIVTLASWVTNLRVDRGSERPRVVVIRDENSPFERRTRDLN